MKKNSGDNWNKIKVITNMIIIIFLSILIILILQKSNTLNFGKNSKRNLLNNEELQINESGEVARTVNSSNWDTSKVTVTKDADGKEVPVPKGYVGSNATGENKVNEGYVIYEGTGVVNTSNAWSESLNRNQWVWIPVPYPDRIYEEVNGIKKAKLYGYSDSGRYEYKNNNYEPAILPEYDTATNLTNSGLTGMTPDKLYQELQKEFDNTIESIKKYGGFYIGRYETGNLSQTKPVVRRINTDIGDQTWYAMYSKMGYLAANSNVKTNMIWGCLYDETFQWMVDREDKSYTHFLNYSNSWGNFLTSAFTYYDGSKNVSKTANQSVKIPTGSTDYAKALNIYDLSGNNWEWTLEGTGTSCRVLRSSSYNEMYSVWPASTRFVMINPLYKYHNIGCRAYLYIK